MCIAGDIWSGDGRSPVSTDGDNITVELLLKIQVFGNAFEGGVTEHSFCLDG